MEDIDKKIQGPLAIRVSVHVCDFGTVKQFPLGVGDSGRGRHRDVSYPCGCGQCVRCSFLSYQCTCLILHRLLMCYIIYNY